MFIKILLFLLCVVPETDTLVQEMMMNYYETQNRVDLALQEASALYEKTREPFYLKKMFGYSVALGNNQDGLKYGLAYLSREFDPQVFFALVPILKNLNRLDTLLKVLEKSLYSADSLSVFLGYIYYLQGKNYEALVNFERNKGFVLNFPILISAYLDLLWKMERRDSLSSYLDAMHSESREVNFLKGLYYRLLGEREKAIQMFRELYYQQNYRDENFLKVFLQLLDEDRIFEAGDTIVDFLLKRNPFSWDVRKVAGMHFYRKGDYERALSELLVSSGLLDSDPEVHYYLARTLAALGVNNDALREIKIAIKINPDSREYLFYKIYLLLVGTNVDEALREIYSAELRFGEDAYLFYLKAEALNSKGDKLNASRNFLKALTLDSKNLKRYADYLVHARSSGIKVSYPEFLNRALSVANSRDDSIFVSYIAMDVEEYNFAILILEALLKSGISDPVQYNNLAYALAQVGRDLDRALELVNKALESEPGDFHFLDTKAWVLFKMGRIDDAMEYIEKAVISGGAEDPEVLRHREIIQGK